MDYDSTSFRDFFNQDKPIKDRLETRIQRGAVGIHRINQRIVPDSARPDLSTNAKVESIRSGKSQSAILSDTDVNQILSIYNISNLTQSNSRELGTTGIVIYFNPDINSYCLKK